MEFLLHCDIWLDVENTAQTEMLGLKLWDCRCNSKFVSYLTHRTGYDIRKRMCKKMFKMWEDSVL